MMRQSIVACVMLPMLVYSCSKDAKPSADAEACEHLSEGSNVSLIAAASVDAAPAVGADHMSYLTTLIDISGGKGGFVKFGAPEATDYLFYFDSEVPVRFLDSTNATVVPEESATSSTTCAKIKARHLVPLAVGTYALQLGPSVQTALAIVVEEAEHAVH